MEHERFGRPANLRPRTAGPRASRTAASSASVSAAAVGSNVRREPRSMSFGIDADALGTNSAADNDDIRKLQQRLRMPSHPIRPKEIPVTAILVEHRKPPARPKSAVAVNRLRMERLSAFPCNQEQEEATQSAKVETTKQDESRSCTAVAHASAMKRPLSAAIPKTKSNQTVNPNMAIRAIGLKRSNSAFSGLRPKLHRHYDSRLAQTQKLSGKMRHDGEQTLEPHFSGPFPQHAFAYAVPVHCLHPCRPYNPYDIVSIPHEELFGSYAHVHQLNEAKFDFYTFSMNGFTYHAKDDGFQATFLPSTDWKRQKEQFDQIRKLPTFVLFRYRKVFLAWKRWIRNTKFEAARDQLLSTLYFSSAPLFTAMQDAQLEITKLEKIQLMWDFEGKTTTLEEFAIQNNDHMHAQGITIKDIHSTIQDILLKVCRECLNSLETPHGIFPGHECALSSRKSSNCHIFDNYIEHQISLATADAQLVRHDHMASSPPKLSLMQEKKAQRAKFQQMLAKKKQRTHDALEDIRWTMAAIRRRKCVHLAKFVRLIDFILMDSMGDVILRSVEMMNHFLISGANGVQIAKLMNRQDYLMAFHTTFQSFRAERSGSGNHSVKLKASEFDHLFLTRHQVKRFLRTSWHGKLQRNTSSMDEKTLTSVWVESKVEEFFFSALDHHFGSNIDKYSMDDLLSIVENVMAKTIVLPSFQVENCSIYKNEAKQDHEPPELSSISQGSFENGAHNIQSIDCFAPIPLFNIDMDLIDSEAECNIRCRPELIEVAAVVGDAITGFGEVFKNISALSSRHELHMILEFASSIRAFEMIENTGNSECQSDNDDNNEFNDVTWASYHERLMERLGDSHIYSLIRINIENVLTDALDGAETFMSCYSNILNLHMQNEQINFDLLKVKFRNDEYTLANMAHDVQTFNEQIYALNMLSTSQQISFSNFDMNNLKNALLPSPTKCLMALHEVLPSLAHERCEALLSFVRDSSKKIEKPVVAHLEQFTTYLLHIEDVNDAMEQKEIALVFLTDFLKTLEQMSFHIPAQTLAIYELCVPEFEALKVAVNEAIICRDADIAAYSPMLAEAIQTLYNAIDFLKAQSNDQSMHAFETPCHEARELATQLVKQSNLLCIESAQLIWTQNIFANVSSAAREPANEFTELDTMSNELKLKKKLWEAICDAEGYLEDKSAQTLGEIDLNNMRQVVTELEATIDRAYDSSILMGVLTRLESAKNTIEGLMPVIRDLRNEHLHQDHWTKLEHKLQCSLTMPIPLDLQDITEPGNVNDESLKLQTTKTVSNLDLPFHYLLDIQAMNHATTIHQVSEEATAEAAIASSFESVVRTWEYKEIPIMMRRDRDGRDSLGLGECVDILTLLEESEILLRVMDFSSYARIIQVKLAQLLSDLAQAKECMDLLLVCQQKWEQMQLLVSIDFLRAYPEATRVLQKHEAIWKALMESLTKRPICLTFGINPDNRQILQNIIQAFESIHATLAEHLEAKRTCFPALFRLSNIELATLLSKARDVNNIQPFLNLCFDNVGKINFGHREAFQDIISVSSRVFPENEVVQMGKNLKARGSPELWLSAIEKRLAEQLRKLTRDVLEMLNKPYGFEDTDACEISQFPLQTILLADEIRRCGIICKGIHEYEGRVSSSSSLHSSKVHLQLDEYHQDFLKRTFGPMSDFSREHMTARHLLLRSCIALQEIRFRDAVSEHFTSIQRQQYPHRLLTGGIEWALQLKYVFDDTNTVGFECHIESSGWKTAYGFNYTSPHAERVLNPGSIRYLYSLFACIRGAQGCVLTGDKQSGKSSLARQLNHVMGRHYFCAQINSAFRLSHAVKLVRGALHSGGTFCLQVAQLTTKALEIIRSMASIIGRIEHAAQLKIPIKGLQCDPITFVPGTAFIFTVHATTTEKLDISVASTQMCHFEVLQREEAYILEALLYSKQFESPKALATKLMLVAEYSRSCECLLSIFSLRLMKSIITTTEKQFQSTTEVYEKASLQTFLLRDELLRYCQPLVDAHTFERLVETVNIVFQNENDSREWFVKQWKRQKLSAEVAMPNGLKKYLEQAAEYYCYVPRQALLDSALEIASAVTNHVGIIISGKPGCGKTTSYQVLMKALNLGRQDIMENLQDNTAVTKIETQTKEDDHNISSKGSIRIIERSITKTEPAKACLDSFAVTHVILPMALSLTQLYGTISQDGKGRTQSIMGCLIRDAQESCGPSAKRDMSDTRQLHEYHPNISGPLLAIFEMQAFHLVVFDGCLHQAWTETLMCVLGRKLEALAMDSSEEVSRRVLCFEDGEFMSVPPNLRFVFESLSLANASPSMLMLNAIICLDSTYSEAVSARSEERDNTVPISYLRRSLLRQRHNALESSLESSFIHMVFDHVHEWLLNTDLVDSLYAVIEEYKPSVHLSQLQRVTYLLSLLQAVLHSVSVIHASEPCVAERKTISRSPNVTSDPLLIRVQMAIVYALMWGYASCTTDNIPLQLLLNGWIKKRFDSISSSWGDDSSKDINLFNTVMDLSSMRFVDLHMVMAGVKPDTSHQSVSSNTNIFIPTESSFLTHSVMKEALRTGHGVLLVGCENARKTTILKSFLGQLNSLNFQSSILMSSPRSSRKKSAASMLMETPYLHSGEGSGQDTKTSLDKIRFHQVSLVSMLATKFKRLAASQKEATTTSTIRPLLAETDVKSLRAWSIMPSILSKKNDMINKFDRGEFVPFFISMNRHDRGVGELSKCLERVLQRERNGVFEPPPGKSVILIIDDLHLPILGEEDNYPSCHEYLRSVYEHSIVYANDNAKKITIESLMLVCSIGTEMMPAGRDSDKYEQKRSILDKLVRQLFPVLAPATSLQELHQIFSARIISEWENSKSSGTRLIRQVQQIIPLIIAGTTVLWEKLRQTIPSEQSVASPRNGFDSSKRMGFNLHDLSRVYDGLCCVESSFLVDSATLIRLWTHECLRSFTDKIPSLNMNANEIAQDIFRMRIIIETINQRQEHLASCEAISATASGKDNTSISVYKNRQTDLIADKGLSTQGLLTTLAADFLEKKPTKVEVKSQSEKKNVNNCLPDSQSNMWGFIPNHIYYQARSQEASENSTSVRKPLIRQTSIKFMRQKSMGGALSNRWIYAELIPEDTAPEFVDNMNQVFLSAMQTFSTIHAAEYRVGSSLSITSQTLQVSSDAPKIPHSMAQKVARITRLYFLPSAKLILLGPAGSGREVILRYASSARRSEQYQKILLLEAIPDADDTIAMWKMLLNELYERVGVDCENVTLILKRIDLFPAPMASQLLSLMSSGEIPEAFSLDEQIKLATRVRDERLVEIENQYQHHVAQIRQALELKREQELAALKKAEKETMQARSISHYEAFELQFQQELSAKLAQMHLRFQQDCDDFYRKCEVENESLSATIMSLMRPLGMTSGKWQQIIDRLRKRLRIVCMVDTENYDRTVKRIPELFRAHNTISLPLMDEESIRVVMYGHFHAEMQHLRRVDFLSIDNDAVTSMSDELVEFLENVSQALPQLARAGAAMHLAVMRVASRSGIAVSTRLACVVPTFFTRLLRHHYLQYVKLQVRAENFLQSFLDMERELWKLKNGDDEARAQVIECDRKIPLYESSLLEQQQRANQLRDMKCRFQAAAEEQVTITNEMERQSQVELHVPLACLEEANAALLLIDKKHIVELKSFNSPPPLVHLVLDAICVMFGIEPAWENARKILSDTNVVQTMLNYDKDSIPNDLLARVEQEYIRDTRFLREEVEKQSVAASMMVVWVRAIYQYASTRRLVLPTLEKLGKAQSRLKLLMREFQVSQQRLAEADALVLESQTAMEECLHVKQKAMEDIESRATRLESGKMALEFLTEDKVEMEIVARNSTQQLLNGLIWWNALLDAGLLAYGGLFNVHERNELFKAWSDACLTFGGLKSSTNPDLFRSSIPTIHLAVKSPDENNSDDEDDTTGTQLREDSEDIAHLFYRRHDWSWKIVPSSGAYFSSRRLQDTYILSMTTFSAFPVVMITRYTHEIEDLLVKCARNLWKWKDFLMINSKADDFETVFEGAVRNGYQLLVLDVEPLDGERTHGKLARAFHWETSIVNGVEHLNVQNKCGSKERSSIMDRAELIPIHASFRLLLTSHETRHAFGDTISSFPALDARIHTSEVTDIILDAMWNPGIFAGQECFKLKHAVRDYELLTQKDDETHHELKVLVQEAAKQGDFQISAMEVLRAKCNATKESRLALLQKRADIETQTHNVKSSKMLAQLGAAIFNSFNNVIADKKTQSSPAMTLQTFIPMYLSALKQPVAVSPSRHEPQIQQNAASIASRPSLTPQLSTRASYLFRQSSRMLVLQQASVRMISTRSLFFNSTPVITKQMLMNFMPLIASQSDWYRFVLNVMWTIEVNQSQHRRGILRQLDAPPKATEEENIKNPDQMAVSELGSVAGILAWKKLAQWNDSSSPTDMLAHCIQGIQDGEQKLLSQVVTGVVVQSTSPGEDLLSSSRARAERIKIGLCLFPQVFRGLCDKLLEIHGVHLSFTRDTAPSPSIQSGNDETDQPDPNLLHGWLNALAPFPEMCCVLLPSQHAFDSFELLHHLFFRTVFTPELQLAVLKDRLTRSYRVFENLEDFYVLPKNIFLQPLVSQNRPLARAVSLHPVVNLLLMIKSFDQIMQMEHSKIDVLESAPLAIVGMQKDRNPVHWEELFHILHRKVHQTASTTFRRHDSVEERRQSVGRRKSNQQQENGTSSPLFSRNAPSSRRLSTTQSMLYRHSDLDLMTPSYPRLVSVVHDWRDLPIHLQKNLLCLHDVEEPQCTDSASFKKALHSTMLRFVYHTCMELLQTAIDERSKAKSGISIRISDPSSQPAMSIWQLLSSLVLFHSLLQVRSQLQVHCSQQLAIPIRSYSPDTFVTALNTLLQTIVQGKASKTSGAVVKGSSERYIYHVVLNVYIQQAVGSFEREFLERLYHECTEIVQQSHAVALAEDNLTSRGPSLSQGTASPRLGLPTQPSFSIGESRRTLLQRKRSAMEVASRRSLVAPWLLAALESALTYPVTNVDEWVEVWWICAEQMDERSMRQQLNDLFGLRTSSDSKSQDLSHAQTVPEWVERFGWETLPAQGEVDFAMAVTRKDALDVIQHVVHTVIPGKISVIPPARVNSLATDQEPRVTNYHALVELALKSCVDGFNDRISRLRQLLNSLVGALTTTTPTSESTSESGREDAKASLQDVEPLEIRHQLLAIMRNQIPPGLLSMRDTFATSHWSLDDLVVFYSSWHAKIVGPAPQDSPWTLHLWLPALPFTGFSIGYWLEIAKLRYCLKHQLDPSEQEAAFALQQFSAGADYKDGGRSDVVRTQDTRSSAMATCFVVFEGMSLSGATWDADRACLRAANLKEPRQHVLVLCSLTLKGNARFDDNEGRKMNEFGLDQQLSMRSCPLICVHDGSSVVSHEFALPAASDLPPLATPFLLPCKRGYRDPSLSDPVPRGVQ